MYKQTTVMVNSEFSIYLQQSKKTSNSNTYTISFPCQSTSLIGSIANLITKQRVLEIKPDSIVFHAFSLISFQTLQEGLTNINVKLNKTLQLIQSLGQQIEYLRENEKKSFYEYNLDHLVVINDNTFLYLSNNLLNLQTLKNKTTMTFTFPFFKQGLVSPEILKINCIPFTVNCKTIYYSLGILSIYFLFNQILDGSSSSSTDFKSHLLRILTPIRATKLYYLLLRCLEIEPERRSLVYL